MQTAQIAMVRAIPEPGHKRRWCGLEKWVEDKKARPNPEEKHGLPWPDTEIKVVVTAKPAPYDPAANGGAPVEISPETFRMLERDPRIAARMLGVGGDDPADSVRLKAELAKVEQDLVEARKEASDAAEAKLYRVTAQQQIEEAGKKIAALENELAQARAQLAKKK